MKNILSPSILAANFTKLGEQMKETEASGAEYLHFDVMDGMFVPNISFGMPVLRSIKGITNQIFDVHLMIEEPIRYVEEFAEAGADILTVHLEACKDVAATLDKIHACGCKAGLSIKPNTPVEELEKFLDKVDMALIMTVEPGFGGQKLIASTLEKIRSLCKILKERQLTIDIEVDGGISIDNMPELLQAGANIIVVGSTIFNGDVGKNTRKFMEILAGN